MKVGTLTFHSTNNNGSFLQAYALQKVLIKLGIENEIINFYTDKQETQYKVFRKNSSVPDLFRNLISLVHYNELKKRYRGFAELRDKHLIMTPRIKTESEVYRVAGSYDAIICGSDQIWNTGARDFSEAYFLPDTSKKKITYAVSCGSSLENVDVDRVLDMAKNFEFNSFRERSTLSELQRRGLTSSKLVVDPTLLLDADGYNKIVSNDLHKGKYIFLYTINYSNQVLQTAKAIGDSMKIPVITVFSGYSALRCLRYGIKVIYNATPDVFLGLMKNAYITCTNSFHGTVFSIIYHKEFYRLCDKDKDGNKIYDDRIDGLLKELGIEKNSITLGDVFVRNRLDYKDIDKKIEDMRYDSIQYIIDALGVR